MVGHLVRIEAKAGFVNTALMFRVETVDSRVKLLVFDELRSSWLIRDKRNIIIETGYAADFDKLLDGLSQLGLTPQDIDYVALTHIHLDHAGGAGHLARHNPNLTVLVHGKGARHLANPSKLIEGARKAHGERFDAFGEMLPIPIKQIRTIDSGDIVELGDTHLEVFYTPGHAKHHVIFFDPVSASVFTGDALGSKYKNHPNFVLSPPTDYDRKSAKISIDLIQALNPQRINFTHCGPYGISGHDHLFENLKRNHDLWTQSIFEIISQYQFEDDETLFRAFLEKHPELKQFPDQFFSFRLSVKGIRLYLQRLQN